MSRRARFVLPFVALLGTSALGGCFLLAAGAGAAGAIAYTNRGASSSIAGSVDATFNRATAAFSAMGITETGRSTDDSGATRRLTGKQGDTEVNVEMKRESNDVTKVEVVAARNTVDFDKDLAKRVLDRIMQ